MPNTTAFSIRMDADIKEQLDNFCNVVLFLACPAGFEPAAFGSGGRHSIRLSYGHVFLFGKRFVSRVLSCPVIYLRNRTRESAGRLVLPYSILLLVGLARHARRRASGELLPRLFTLARFPGRYIFCGAFLGFAPTGVSPAPCPAEPGLSSIGEPTATG